MFDRLIDILLAVFSSLIPWKVVQPYEKAVLVRLGQFVRVLEPGFHWVIPLHIDHVYNDAVTPRTELLTGLATDTKDGKAAGFDAVLASSEDQDLALRHTATGGRIAFVPEARVVHCDSALDIRSYCRRAEWGAEHMIPFCRRYPDWPANDLLPAIAEHLFHPGVGEHHSLVRAGCHHRLSRGFQQQTRVVL